MNVQANRFLWLGVIWAGALLVLAGCASRPTYTAKALDTLDTERAEGIVTEQGKGRFALKDNWTGEVHSFNTAYTTQFIPKGYRSQAGDEIRVIYKKVMRRGYDNQGSPFLRKVYQIQSINVAPENEMPEMPMKGRVTLIGKGSISLRSSGSFVVQLEGNERSYRVHWPARLDDTVPGGVKGLLGQTVEVWAKRVPNLRFNCYHYVAEKVTIVSEEAITQVSF